MKRWTVVVLSLLLCFLLDSSLLPWIIPSEWRGTEMLLYPRLVLVGVIYVGILANRHVGAVVGGAFGLLQDIDFFGHMLGVNAFTYALSAYVAGLLIKKNALNLFSVFFVQFAALLLSEASLFASYRLFSIINEEFAWAFLKGMLPSLLADLLFALILYIPARRWFESSLPVREPEEK